MIVYTGLSGFLVAACKTFCNPLA